MPVSYLTIWPELDIGCPLVNSEFKDSKHPKYGRLWAQRRLLQDVGKCLHTIHKISNQSWCGSQIDEIILNSYKVPHIEPGANTVPMPCECPTV